MVDRVINALIAGVVGVVAFIAVSAIVSTNIYTCDPTANADNGSWATTGMPYNSANATAGEVMMHDMVPLAVAIMVVVGLFMGLTKIRGID